jgi:hypothetical protein
MSLVPKYVLHLLPPAMTTTFQYHKVPLGIDISGLGTADQLRITQIGLWAWMDEVSEQPTGKKPSRYSLEYRQAQMKHRVTRLKT